MEMSGCSPLSGILLTFHDLALGIGLCGGLNEDGSHCLIHLNVWFLSWWSVLERLWHAGGGVLLGMEFKSPHQVQSTSARPTLPSPPNLLIVDKG